MVVAGDVDKRRHRLGQRGVLVGEDRVGDGVERLERARDSAGRVGLERVGARDEDLAHLVDDGDDGDRQVGAAGRLDVREAGAQEGERARLDRRVGEVEEPQERVGERARRHERDGRVHDVVGALDEVGLVLCRDRVGRRGRQVEQAANDLHERDVDGAGDGRRARRVDLADELLGLERKREEVEERERLLLDLGRRGLVLADDAGGGSRLEERRLEGDDVLQLVDDLLVRRELGRDVEVLDERERQGGRLARLVARLVDEEHGDGRQELLGAERLDEAREQVDAAVARDVRRRVGKGAQELAQLGEEAVAAVGRPLHRLDERRDDVVERLVDHAQRVGVVALQNVGAHEGEDGHDVVDELVGDEGPELRQEEERLRVRLRVDRRPHEVEDGRHPDRVARDARRRLDVLDDARERAEDELARVRHVGLAGRRRQLDERREEVEQAEEEAVRRRDRRKLDRLEDDDELGQALGAARRRRCANGDRRAPALGALGGRRRERVAHLVEEHRDRLAVGLGGADAGEDVGRDASVGRDGELDEALEELEAGLAADGREDRLGDEAQGLLAQDCAQTCRRATSSQRRG